SIPAVPDVVDTFDSSVHLPVCPTTALPHTPRCPQSSDRPFLPLRHWPCSRHTQTTARPCGIPCRTARGSVAWAILSLCRATSSATSEHYWGLLASSPISPSFVTSSVSFQLRSLPSFGITWFHRYYEPLCYLRRSGLAL